MVTDGTVNVLAVVPTAAASTLLAGAFTVTLAVPVAVTPSRVREAVMVVAPGVIAVTTPVELTIAVAARAVVNVIRSHP